MEEANSALRLLEPQWNAGMICASIAISLLGTFTSTQLMCQARMSLKFRSVLIWTLLSSLTFGFCSIWSLHFVAMLACELDVPIGIDAGLTILSAILAVSFTFTALGSDLLWESYHRNGRRKRKTHKKRAPSTSSVKVTMAGDESTVPLLGPLTHEDLEDAARDIDLEASERPPITHRKSSDKSLKNFKNAFTRTQRLLNHDVADSPQSPRSINSDSFEAPAIVPRLPPLPSPVVERMSPFDRPGQYDEESSTTGTESLNRTSSDMSSSRRSSSFMSGSNSGSTGLSSLMNLAHRTSGIDLAKNPFIATAEALWHGFTVKNVCKGFIWSLAITSMHYVGIAALEIPNGKLTLNPWFVMLSAIISWAVCSVGCILLASMETRISQQILFSIVGTTGVAAMHFTGMRAAKFWSNMPPSDIRGYPPQVAVAVVSIAIITCIVANGLLAHAATVSRNKLAEIVWTRRRLWRTIAQKENAEAAAAARSDFIASASHEIRTPLHHLQGYSDLLSRTELTEEGRVLLYAIQRATKTLSLITNNVLDWSKLERDKDDLLRPVALDMRSVCESILVLLPNKDDDTEVEVMVVITPDVPKSIFLDETYIHRILMNLLSNALKFTRSGYVLLTLEVDGLNNIVARVKDSGCGVPPSFLPELFEPFKQAQTRGSQRGTGLGLSIVKQLLHKMNGKIEVESRHPEIEEVAPEMTGSTFTITIPLQAASPVHRHASLFGALPTVAMFHSGSEKCLEGLKLAWQHFGYNVVMVSKTSDLTNMEFRYLWADSSFLEENPRILRQLLDQERWIVLVPYDNQDLLRRLPGLVSAPQCVTLQRPLMWHTFEAKVAIASQIPAKNSLNRSVRFAPKVDILDGQNKEQPKEASTSKNLTVLLVEDNPINKKLGTKMLTSLGYQVLTAENGDEAIEQILKFDTTVDMILMDQSMPVKDGVTATKEIRALEASEKLARRHPIIAVTAVVNTESRALFKAAGADDFLAKPLSLSKLESTLATFLRVE